MQAFSTAWNRIEGSQLSLLQKAYIEDNPHKTGSKHLLVENLCVSSSTCPGNSLEYHMVHAEYHQPCLDVLNKQKLYDIFLLDLDGNVVYSVYKELDYATNVQHGKYTLSGLGKVLKKVLIIVMKESKCCLGWARY